MKLALTLALFIGAARGFSPSSVQQSIAKQTSLQAATGLPPGGYGARRDDGRVRKVSKSERNRMADVMIDPDYTLTIAMASLCPLIIWYHPGTFLSGDPSLHDA